VLLGHISSPTRATTSVAHRSIQFNCPYDPYNSFRVFSLLVGRQKRHLTDIVKVPS